MIRVCLSGARGRMGRMLVDLIARADDLVLASALERSDHPDLGLQVTDGVRLTEDARAGIQAAEVLLDFSLPAAVAEHATLVAEMGKPLVTGTTGLSPEQMAALRRASAIVAVVHGSNMSRGVWILNQLVHKAAVALAAEVYDAEIEEIHHRHKVDAPSGTALQLVQAIRDARAGGELVTERAGARKTGQIGVCALRGGDVVGAHRVLFLGPGEELVIAHRATTREHFCRGALDAVRFVAGRAPGLYAPADVFRADSAPEDRGR